MQAVSGFRKRDQRVSGGRHSDNVAQVVEFKGQSDNERISDQDWLLIQENGSLATLRLNELLKSKRFHRLKASEQARLIQLAQDRAYGRPDPGIKRSVKLTLSAGADATAQALADLTHKARLPEYRTSQRQDADGGQTLENDPTYPTDYSGPENG